MPTEVSSYLLHVRHDAFIGIIILKRLKKPHSVVVLINLSVKYYIFNFEH